MQPLKGLKVVDLTTFLATPTTGRILGEWGADVINVEAFKGDPCRVNQAVVFGMPSSDEENLAFDVANFHKRFVALNLKSEKGLEVMMKLLAEADVFITNTRTGRRYWEINGRLCSAICNPPSPVTTHARQTGSAMTAPIAAGIAYPIGAIPPDVRKLCPSRNRSV